MEQLTHTPSSQSAQPIKKSHLISTLLRRVRWFPVAVPMILIALFIIIDGTNLPWWDEWDSAMNSAIHATTGTLTLQDVFTQHTNHRIVFTNLVSAANGVLFRWDLHKEMWVSYVLMAATFFLLVRLHRVRRSVVLLTALSIVMFSPRQPWLWSFENQIYFAVFFSVVVLYALERSDQHPLRGWLIAAIAAVCASYSFGFGWMSWFLGGAVLLWKRADRRYIVAWGLIAALNLGVYFSAYRSEPGEIDLFGAHDVFAAVGALFTQDADVLYPVSGWLGVLALVMLGLNARYVAKRGFNVRPPLLLAGYIFGILLLISVGQRFVLNSRYTAISALFWFAAVLLMYEVFRHRPPRLLAYLNIIIIGLMVGLYIFIGGRYHPNFGGGPPVSNLPMAEQCLYTVDTAPTRAWKYSIREPMSCASGFIAFRTRASASLAIFHKA